MRRRASGLCPSPLRQPEPHRLALFLAVSTFLLLSSPALDAAQVAPVSLPVVISVPETPPGATAQIRLSLRTPHQLTSGYVAVDLDPAVFGPATAADVFSAYGDQLGVARLNDHHVEVFFRSPLGGIGRLPGMPVLTITAPVLVNARAGDTASIAMSFGGKPWKDLQGYQFLPETESGLLRVGGSMAIETVTPGGGLLPRGTHVRISGQGFNTQTKVEIEGVVLQDVVFLGPLELEAVLGAPADLTGKRVVLRNQDGSEADFYPALRGRSSPSFQGAAFQPIFPSRTDLAANGWPMVQNASTEPVDLTYTARIGAGVYLRYPTATGRLEPGEMAAGPPTSLAQSVSASSAWALSASKPVRMMSFRAPTPEEGGSAGELIPLPAGSIAPALLETWTEGKPVCVEDLSASLSGVPACVAWPAGPTRPNPLALSLSASASSVAVTASAATEDGAAWLSISPERATVCGSSSDCRATTFSVRMNSLILEPGEYGGSITFTAEGSGYPPRKVPVILRVASNIISVKPAGSLVFSSNADGASTVPVVLEVTSSGTPAQISASVVSEQKDGEWLSISPTEATTPATLTVTATPSALKKGVSAAVNSIRIAGPANGLVRLASLYLPWKAPVQEITTSAGRDPVRFWMESGSETGATRFLGTGIYSPDLVRVSTENGGEWLTAVLTQDSNGARGIQVSAQAAALPAGVYRGSVELSSAAHPDYVPAQVGVFLGVWSPPLPLTVSPEELRISVPSGSSPLNGCSQDSRLRVSSMGLPIGSDASASTVDGHAWLKVTKGTYGEVCALVDARDLPPGDYEGALQITAPEGSQNEVTVPVALRVTPALLPVVAAGSPLGFTLVNAASQTLQAVAPGEVISVLGSNLGPAGGVNVSPDGEGRLPSEAGGVRLLIDGVPAPLLAVSQTEIRAIAPYEIEGRAFFEAEVEFQEVRTLLGGVPAAVSAPGLFTVDGLGRGQAQALNHDGSENGAGNPAERGTTITLRATGLGAVVPAGRTGAIASDERKVPVLTLAASIDGLEAVVVEARSIAGQAEGNFQVEVQVPEGVAPGLEVPVVLRAGSAASPSGVTIAVK